MALRCSQTKTAIIQFLAKDWQKDEARKKLDQGMELFVTYGESCIRITSGDIRQIVDLQSSQEEADTRLLLHTKHASASCDSVVIVADNTDVFVLCLAHDRKLHCQLYLQRGFQSLRRCLNISALSEKLGEEFCENIIGAHAFTGCDSVSSFAGHGKLTVLKLLKDSEISKTFAQLGKYWQLTEPFLSSLQKLTCKLYACCT